MDEVCYHNYRRGMPTTSDLVGHANQLGINLRYNGIPITFPAKQRSNRAGSPWSPRTNASALSGANIGNQSYSSVGSAKSIQKKPVDSPVSGYIHNLVVPLSREGGSRQLYTPHSSTSRVKSSYTHRSQRSGLHTPSIQPTAPNSRVQSARKPRPHSKSSSQRELSALGHVTSSQSTLGNSAGSKGPQKSTQSLRFETEQSDLQKCRTRKRTSEIQPHRVDRMYYMTGSTLRVKPKYHVENEELIRLRELSRARQEEQPHRGVSNHRGDQYIPDHLQSNALDDPTRFRTPVPSLRAGSMDGSTSREQAENGTETGRKGENESETERVGKEEIESVSEGPLSARGKESEGQEGVTDQLNDLQIEDSNSATEQPEVESTDEQNRENGDNLETQQENVDENLESSNSNDIVQVPSEIYNDPDETQNVEASDT